MHWEYKIKIIEDEETWDKIEILNKAGRKGWELVSVNENQYTFKRPVD